MAKWVHRLSQIDEVTMTGVCANCGPVRLYKNTRRLMCYEKRKIDKATYRQPHTQPQLNQAQRRRKNALKDTCNRCGFIPEDPCQLQVDHILPQHAGGSHDTENLQTLCCNCHALKTKMDAIKYGTKRGKVNA